MDIKHSDAQDIENKIKSTLIGEPSERLTEEAPKIIKELYITPYRYFSYMFWQKGYKSIIDVGCGNGYGTMIMKGFFRKVLAIDKQEKPIVINEFIQCDATKIPVGNRKFDGIFCFETIEHNAMEEQKLIVKEINRISKRGFVIGSTNRDGPNFIEGIEIYKGSKNPYHIKELGLKDWIEISAKLETQGCQIELMGSYYRKGQFIIEHISDCDLIPYCYYLLVMKREDRSYYGEV